MILRALAARRIDGRGLARQAGIDPSALSGGIRLPQAAVTRLWHLAVEAADDPCFGLHVAGCFRPTAFHALSYSLVSSPTMLACLERVVRYSRVVNDSVAARLESEGDRCRFVIDVPADLRIADEAIDAVFAIVVLGAHHLHLPNEVRIFPRSVRLRRPEPAGSDQFHELFNVRVQFSQPENVLEWARADLEKPLPTADEELAKVNDAVIGRYLDQIDHNRLASRIRSVLVEAFTQGDPRPSRDQIASKLAMTPRTMQRRLSEEGTTYATVLDETQAVQAREYLRDRRYSVMDVAFLLGFSSPGGFTRAFRRWTGLSPREWAERERR